MSTHEAARTPDEDLDLIMSFSSNAPYRAQRARIAEWFKWRPSSAHACPRALAGRRCIQDRGCICHRHHGILDHSRMWRDRDGERVMTAEPYNFAGREFAAFNAECDALGLRIDVHGISPYFPGRTTMLIIRRDTPETRWPLYDVMGTNRPAVAAMRGSV